MMQRMQAAAASRQTVRPHRQAEPAGRAIGLRRQAVPSGSTIRPYRLASEKDAT